MSSSTIGELNKKAYVHMEEWHNRLLQGGKYPYVYVDGIYLRRNWGGEFENVAIAVNEDGYREVLGDAEGMKEDKARWGSFFQWFCGRSLDVVKLVVGVTLVCWKPWVKCFLRPNTNGVQSTFYRNVFAVTPRSKAKLVAKMLKEIHARESKKAAREETKAVVEEQLKEAAKKVEDGIEETLTYCDFPVNIGPASLPTDWASSSRCFSTLSSPFCSKRMRSAALFAPLVPSAPFPVWVMVWVRRIPRHQKTRTVCTATKIILGYPGRDTTQKLCRYSQRVVQNILAQPRKNPGRRSWSLGMGILRFLRDDFSTALTMITPQRDLGGNCAFCFLSAVLLAGLGYGDSPCLPAVFAYLKIKKEAPWKAGKQKPPCPSPRPWPLCWRTTPPATCSSVCREHTMRMNHKHNPGRAIALPGRVYPRKCLSAFR